MTPVDLHVARRVRGKRRALGLSEDTLAQALGIATARLQAYERALETVPDAQLARLGEILGVPIAYFLPSEVCRDG